MADEDTPKPVRPGMWRVALDVVGDNCYARTPCCTRRVAIDLADLTVLGQVTIHCPACGKQWELRHDPWRPGTDALWID